jgi:hypothetical protein
MFYRRTVYSRTEKKNTSRTSSYGVPVKIQIVSLVFTASDEICTRVSRGRHFRKNPKTFLETAAGLRGFTPPTSCARHAGEALHCVAREAFASSCTCAIRLFVWTDSLLTRFPSLFFLQQTIGGFRVVVRSTRQTRCLQFRAP